MSSSSARSRGSGQRPDCSPEDPFLETYLVRPGGATVVSLEPDERLTVVDAYGGQVAELTVLSPEGADDAAAVGARADAPATVLRELVRNGNGLLCDELAAPRLDPEEARRGPPLRDLVATGPSQSFRAERAVKVVVAAPGGRIVDGAPPPSDLLVEIRRSTPRTYGQLELPPPLAEPRLDFRVDKATALALRGPRGRVHPGHRRRGEAVLRLPRLPPGPARGRRRARPRCDGDPLDHWDRRIPQPGLFGKFYDADMNPLVEVVRDTVGRHDTFQLACTPKYYEDMGYPGPRQLHGQLQRRRSTVRDRAAQGLARAQLLLQHRLRRSLSSRSTSPGHAPATTCSCGRMTTSSAPRPPAPTTSTRRTAGRSRDVHVRVYPAEQHVLDGDRAARDRRRRAGADAGDELPPAHERADEELHRVPRLLAPALLRQRGRDRGVLGVPREGGGHGPLPASQVGGPRP